MDTLLIELTNKNALKLIHDLEALEIIKVIEENIEPPNVKLSDKYRGVFSSEDAQSFDQHIQSSREEWDNI